MSQSNTCPACGSCDGQDLEVVSVAEQHRFYAPAEPDLQDRLTIEASKSSSVYRMRRCSRCELEFSLPLRAPNSQWYVLAYQALPLYPQTRWEFNFVLNQLIRNDRVFEIGCGNGAFLAHCRDRGITARGIDFSEAAVQKCKALGLAAELFDVGISSNREEQATAVVAFHVLEHLDQPLSLFERAAEIASNSANLWIAIPSPLRPSRTFLETDIMDQPPHHMTRWTARSLAEIGHRSRWRLENVVYEPISFSAQIWYVGTRTTLYRKFITGNKEAERRALGKCLRYLLLPYCIYALQTRYRCLSGFTLLAKYRRDQV